MSEYNQYLQRKAIKNSGGCCCPKGDKGNKGDKGDGKSKGFHRRAVNAEIDDY